MKYVFVFPAISEFVTVSCHLPCLSLNGKQNWNLLLLPSYNWLEGQMKTKDDERVMGEGERERY